MKIYTKVGDGGDTYLFGDGKVRKDHPRVNAYGDVDEMNSVLGWAETLAERKLLREDIEKVQGELFILGADLSTPPGSRPPKQVPRIGTGHIKRLEKEIDTLSARLPKLENFILPGGSGVGAVLHLARAVCRRAERSLVPILKKDRSLSDAQIYLNRLSDYLFILARTANLDAKRPERIWKTQG
jgi:cob(I)alamin adenosyltransferase